MKLYINLLDIVIKNVVTCCTIILSLTLPISIDCDVGDQFDDAPAM